MSEPVKKKHRQIVDGVLLLDKPVGLSSNDALVRVKRILNVKKAGHTGTLDPFATGLLSLCFGEATKFSNDLLEADKTYEATLHLGITTTTGDTEGEITAQSAVDCTEIQVRTVMAGFLGEIEQIPPMYSALKRDGKPLYEYAREGITLERPARRVRIDALELIEFNSPLLRIRVTCSKGTYIRVLGEDIGRALGCGAHLCALRRTQVGHLSLAVACTLAQLEKDNVQSCRMHLLPVDSLLSTFPGLSLPQGCAERFMQGQRIALDKEGVLASIDEGRVRVYRSSDACLLGTAWLKTGRVLAPERLIATHDSKA